MTDTQVIKGIELPRSQGPYMIYMHGDMRPDGTEHESDRILARVRRKRGKLELLAVRGAAHVRGKYALDFPTMGISKMATIAAAARFAFELNQQLKNCAEALAATEY